MTAQILADGPTGLHRAVEVLRSGGLVAFPTETVYGLGADATDDRAVAAIFAAKERPRFNPLIVHVESAAAAAVLVDFDARAERLAEAYWPGPLSLVLPRRDGCPVSLLAGAGLDTLAVRVPGHPLALRLLSAAGRPLAAPSANRSGAVSPTTPQHVRADLGDTVPVILAAGRCPVGLESTVVDLSESTPRLLRPGAVIREDIEALIGPLTDPTADGDLRSPGMLRSHYAPSVPVRLEAAQVGEGEALLTFGPDLRKGDHVRNLSEDGDLHEAAANLFGHLRALDRPGVRAIAVVPIPTNGLGEAINDRLRRAAAPRDAPASSS